MASSSDIVTPPEFVRCVLGLTQYLKYPAMTVKAFAMLNAHFGQMSELVAKMQKTQIVVVSEVAKSVNTLSEQVSELQGHAKWLTAPAGPNRAMAFDRCTTILKYWSSLLKPGSRVQIMGRTDLMEVTPVEVMKFQSILRSLGGHEKALVLVNLPLGKGDDALVSVPRSRLKQLFEEAATGGKLAAEEAISLCRTICTETGVLVSSANFAKIKEGFPSGGWELKDYMGWYTEIFVQRDPEQKKGLQDVACTFLARFAQNNETNQKAIYGKNRIRTLIRTRI